jgi:hypothetical protein
MAIAIFNHGIAVFSIVLPLLTILNHETSEVIAWGY